MNHLEISLRERRTNFRPNEWLEGRTEWALDAPPKSVEIRLLWFTRGRGTTDASVVESSQLALGAMSENSFSSSPAEVSASAMGDTPFRFRLPEAPHSFSGTLISLVWAVEVVALPSKTTARVEFTLSPTGDEIVLSQVEKPMSEIEKRFKSRKDEFLRSRDLNSR